MTKRQTTACVGAGCTATLGLAVPADPPGAQVWTCVACGTRNHVPDGDACDCPRPGPWTGCHCLVARRPGAAFASDDWCNCLCHVS